MTISGGEAPWTVQLALKGVVKKGDAFTVLHKVNGSYEIINAVAIDDNILQFQTSSASPFAIVTGTATATSVVAPKTGEVIALSAILAIVMMAGAALCAKKARLQK